MKPSDPYLIKTLPENLLANQRDQDQVEFVVLAPKAWQPLDEIRNKFEKEIENGYLRIATYDPTLQVGILRNLSFQLAEGKILSNLESSDFTGSRAGNFFYNELTSVPNDTVMWVRKAGKITSRISVWRDTFYEIGGFDEDKKYSKQCANLIHRLNLYGVETNFGSNDYFTRSLVKSPRSFFSQQPERETRKLTMTHLEECDIDLL
ncbi:MAG: hypothetical protein GY816_01850 [Cytophagales bacterium]|nr:hypothetical protein [Cytophagales bacterium]